MAHQVDVQTICAQCSGTGVQPGGGGPGAPGPFTCTWPGCEGKGYYNIGYVIMDDILNAIHDDTALLLTQMSADLTATLNQMLSDLADMNERLDTVDDKLNDVMDKCNDIKEKVDTL